jgi:hypothetical protein
MVVTALAGVGVGVLLFLIVLNAAGPKSAEQSADATFEVGSAERLAKTVADTGPLLFQDLLNRDRDIYVQHLGGDDWRTFEAHAPGAPRRCVLEWRPATRDFRDPCDGRTYPADGTGLTRYATKVEKGALIVDLGDPQSGTTTGSQ